MCRLLGLAVATGSSELGLPVRYHLVDAPHSLRFQSENGAVPDGSAAGHDDSWGIGWFDASGKISLQREIGSAATAAGFAVSAFGAEQMSAEGGPARVVVAHLRKASCGAITAENAHPVHVEFRKHAVGSVRTGADSLLVAHNGTIHEPLLSLLRGELTAAGREEGNSDSDTVILAGFLALRLDKAPIGQAVHESLGAALRHIFVAAAEMSPAGDPNPAYTAVNLLMASAQGLFALRQFTAGGDYYTLFARPVTNVERPGGGWVVASEPTDDSAAWQALTPGVLYCYPTEESGASDAGPTMIAVSPERVTT